HRPRPRAHPRLQRHDPSLPGHRPHEIDLPLPGPRLSLDGRTWECREGIARLVVRPDRTTRLTQPGHNGTTRTTRLTQPGHNEMPSPLSVCPGCVSRVPG